MNSTEGHAIILELLLFGTDVVDAAAAAAFQEIQLNI